MSARPWYHRYPSDFLAGTITMRADERGVYSCLLDRMYERGKPIPMDNPRELARMCGCSTRRFNQIVAMLLLDPKKLVLRDGALSNPRFENQYPQEVAEAKKLSENGRKKAQTSKINETKVKNKPNQNQPAASNNNELPLGLDEALPDTRYQKPESKKEKKVVVRRASAPHPIPEDWTLSKVDIDYGITKGFDARKIDDMGEAFRDHYRSRGTKWVDWAATWRTWVRKAIEFAAERAERQPYRPAGAAPQRPKVTAADIAAGVYRRT